jgi:tripartite-type tricarboxylate transporter receptor subunit TctC
LGIFKSFVQAFVAASVLLTANAASAQTYPDRPITIIIPFAPGGGTDVVARAMAPALGAKLGQTIVIENVSGAAGNIAAGRVARAAPDGYTLIMHNLAFALNAGLYARLPYDSEKDFVPIAMINNTANAFVARKTLPVNTVPELVAWMKSNTAKLGHPGVGSTGHIGVALLARAVGVNADFIPYRGGGPMLQDIIAGHVDMGTVTVGNAVEPLNNGLVKALGVTGPTRAKLLPQVPSLVQDLSPILEVLFWNVLMAPGGTPKPVIDKIYAAFEETVKDPALVESWAKMGIDLYPPEQRTPEATRTILREEIARWGKIIRENKFEAPQ